MAKKKSNKPHFPRRRWTRNPIQKPHSSKHGNKGYDRKRDKDEDIADLER